MILATVVSKNNVTIRLTDERWTHIITSHLEFGAKDFKKVTKAIEDPDFILIGDSGELLAVKQSPGSKTYIVVPYKELSSEDGFILTAYLTTDSYWLFQRKILWNKE